MNSKKLFKTLLWSLAGLTLVLTGCTKKDPGSSPTSSPSDITSSGGGTTSSGGSSSSSETPIPEPTSLKLDVVFNWDTNTHVTTEGMSIWTDRYVDGTIAPLSDNVSGIAADRRTTNPENDWRWNFAVDANGYIVYASWGTNGGYGGPSDGFYYRPISQWDKDEVTNTGTGNDDFPVFAIGGDWAPWDAPTCNNYDYVIPEGGFIITGRGEDANGFVRFLDFIYEDRTFTSDEVVALQEANALLENQTEKGYFDDYYVFINEEKQLEVMSREDVEDENNTPAYLCAEEDAPTDLYDDIADVITMENDTEVTVRGVITNMYADGVLIIADNTGSVLVKDTTLQYIPAKSERVYALDDTVAVEGTFSVVDGQNTITPTAEPEVLSKYWEITPPSPVEIVNYSTQWVVANQNKVVTMKELLYVETTGEISTFKDSAENVYKGRNIALPTGIEANDKFDIRAVLQVENGNEVVFRTSSVNDLTGYATVTLVNGTFKDTDESVKDFALGSKVTIVADDRPGERFVRWVSGDSVATTKEYEIPVNGDVTWTAEYSDKATITVVNGTISGQETTTVEFTIGTQVTIVANEAESGYIFAGWYSSNVKVSDLTEYTFEVTDNATYTATYQIEAAPVPGAIDVDVYNEDLPITGSNIGVYVAEEIDGKLPQTSTHDSTKYTANNYKDAWGSIIAVDSEGRIVALGYKHWTGHGGGYTGSNPITAPADVAYAGTTGLTNPAYTASEAWQPWPAETRNEWDFVIPEGGFLISVNGAEKTAELLSQIYNAEDLKDKMITYWEKDYPSNVGKNGHTGYQLENLKAEYTLPENVRIYLTFDKKIIIEHESNVKAIPTIINPQEQTSEFALWSGTWVNGTIAPESPNTWGNVLEGSRTFMTPTDASGGSIAGFTFGVNAQGKLVYASYGLNAGFGSPGDEFYSRIGEGGKANPIFSVSDNYMSYNEDLADQVDDGYWREFELVVPLGGFVFTVTDPTDEGLIEIMNMLMDGIVDTPYSVDNPVPTNNDTLFGNIYKAGLVADGAWDHFTFSLTKTGKICVVDDNAPTEDTPQENVDPYKDTYSVFVEDSENAVASGIDPTRTAVVESADRNEEPYLTDTGYEHLYIAVDSEGRIAYLVFAPSAGHGTAYADSYYRNSYYAYGTREDGELPDHEFGTDRVNPALVVDPDSPLSWGYYSKWQIVVPQGGFVVVAKGDAANEFLSEIFGKTFDLSTKDSREVTATEINRSVELHTSVSDDTTLTLDRETLEVTVNAGLVTTKAYVQVVGGTFKDETTTAKVVDKNTSVTVVANDPVDQTFLGWYNGDELLSNDKEYTHLVEDSITLTAKFAIAEKGFAYEVLNPETDPDGKFAVYTDEEVNGTTAPLSENTWGNVPEGRKTFFKEIQYRYGYTIAVDAEGYIVYASYGLNNGYGSPADGFYSRVGGEGKNNPIFYVADNWAPWPDPNFGSFDWVVPEGGFVVTGLATHPTMVNLIKHLTGATSVPTNNNALFETQTADGSLDKWHLSLTEIGNIRVQDRTNLQDEPNYVTAPVVVTGGTVNGETTANLEVNSMVTVVADTQEGTFFAGWYNEYDELVSSDVSYTFKLSASGATLTAKFVTEIAPAVELTVNVENATITAVNDQPYVEGETKIHFNDTVTVEKAEDVEFVKWQQDGVDVSSSLESNVPVVKDEPYTFVAQKETTTIKAVTKQEYSVGSFDVAVGLDGYGSLNSYWAAGTSVKVGTTMPNQWRMALVVNGEGTITQVLSVLSATDRLVVEDGFVLVGHLTPFNNLLSYMLGETILDDETNKAAVLARLDAEKADYKLVVENGVLTISKLVAKNRVDLVDMIEKAQENDIVKIGATTIDITDIELTKPIVLQGVNQESTVLTSSKHISTSLKGIKDLSITILCHVDVAENANTTFENVTITVTEETMPGVRGEGALRFFGGNGAVVVKNCTLNGTLWVFGTEENQDLSGITGNNIHATQSGIVYHANTETATANMTAEDIRLANGTIIVDDLRDRVVVIEDMVWGVKDSSAPAEATITLENAEIASLNGVAYEEGRKTLVGDVVSIKKADSVENFIKWQQDGVDVSSTLKDGVLITSDENYTFTLEENTTITAVSKTAVAAEGKFDVAVGLDGYGTLMSYWTTGQTIQKGTTLANEWRTLITVDTTGKITAISYGVHSPVTVGEGFVIAGHDATVNEFLTYALGTDIVIKDENRNTIYADLLAMADNLTLSVTDGVLTVTKTTVEPEPTPDYSIGQITEANQEYTVRGVVVAKSSQALVVSDGTNSVYVYDRDIVSNFSIGDYVEVTGGVTSYNKAFQFAYNGNPAVSVTKLDEDPALTIPEATLLTTEIVNSWTTAEAFTTADIKEYTWTAVAGKSGNYDTLNLAGADVTIEPIGIDSDVYTIVTGKTYEVKAYFVGYYSYASIVLTELKEVVIPVEGITIEANRTEVTVGQSVTFTATLTPQGAFGEVTYAITEGTELGSIEGNVLTTTGAGTIKVQASVDELTSNEVIITITEATEPAPETPVETSFEMKGFATTAGGYQEEDQTAEFDGVTYVAKNYIGQSGQIRGKETSVSKNFQLANTTEMPGVITKIEIISTATGNNKFSASMKVAVGTTSQADVASVENCIDGTLTSNTHMTFEFDVAEGITYFKLLSEAKFTSGSLTGCTIKITYMV